jgi:hypothetical protein
MMLGAGGAGKAEVSVAPPERDGAGAELAGLDRAMPGVIIGGRGTDVVAPFGRLWLWLEKDGRAMEGADCGFAVELLAAFEEVGFVWIGVKDSLPERGGC